MFNLSDAIKLGIDMIEIRRLTTTIARSTINA